MSDPLRRANGGDKSLEQAFADLDSDISEGLQELAETNPELLREVLADLGYLPGDNRVAENRESTQLDAAQQRLLAVLDSMGNPRTADEVVELIETEAPEFIEEYQSAKHRSWVSTKLNGLVDAGELGRFRDGRVVRYTATPAEAVRHWALHNNRFVEELDMADAREISNDTNMPIHATRRGLRELIQNE